MNINIGDYITTLASARLRKVVEIVEDPIYGKAYRINDIDGTSLLCYEAFVDTHCTAEKMRESNPEFVADFEAMEAKEVR